MKESAERLYFQEGQRFPFWIRGITLVPVAALGLPAGLAWLGGGSNLGILPVLFTVLALLSLAGAALTFATKLETRLESGRLRLRIHPLGWSLLPRRMTRKDIALDDVSRWEVRTYNPLRSTEYWGWHFWGLGVGKGGRYLYMMRPGNPFSGRGVQLWLSSGERVLVGSERPEVLGDAIAMAKRESR